MDDHEPPDLPFHDRFVDAIQSGRKTMTSRNSRYGKAGDILWTPAGFVRLLDVRKCEIETVAQEHYHEEGLDSPEEFREVWREIHPRKGWVPDQEIWLHEFEHIDTKDADGRPKWE